MIAPLGGGLDGSTLNVTKYRGAGIIDKSKRVTNIDASEFPGTSLLDQKELLDTGPKSSHSDLASPEIWKSYVHPEIRLREVR